LRKSTSKDTGGNDTFDLFSGALNNNDSFDSRKKRSASVGCDRDSIHKRAVSPKRGTPGYLAPVANPHQVKSLGPEVKDTSSDDNSIDEKKRRPENQAKKPNY